VEASAPVKWADIDLGAVAHNVGEIQRLVGARTQLMAVVKANGYGHGAVPVARTALRAGAGWLGVSSPAEAMELRAAGIVAPILNLGYTPETALLELIQGDVSLTVWDARGLPSVATAAAAAQRAARVHLKVDTGMGRLGARSEDAQALARDIVGRPHLALEGLCTHLADAENADRAYTDRQLEQFDRVRDAVSAIAPRPPLVHAANSAALLRHPRSRYDLVRPGILLYGAHPMAGWTDLPLRPAMTVSALVTHVKEVPAGTRVGYGLQWSAAGPRVLATVAAGYADGFSRRLSNRGHVLIGGKRCPIVGRVSMDQIIADATGARVQVADPAVLLGRQGNEELSVDEVAAAQDTISWEVFCAISARVPRRYREGDTGLIL
jgi:alanine racemase